MVGFSFFTIPKRVPGLIEWHLFFFKNRHLEGWFSANNLLSKTSIDAKFYTGVIWFLYLHSELIAPANNKKYKSFMVE